MKTRQGFVSNSSSSSFLVSKAAITVAQMEQIRDAAADNDWSFYEDGPNITGYTIVDNFDMYGFMLQIGVPQNAIDMERD